MMGTGLQLGITSTEGLGEFHQAVWLFYIKNIAIHIAKNIFYM
jgi:hypothetical protein